MPQQTHRVTFESFTPDPALYGAGTFVFKYVDGEKAGKALSFRFESQTSAPWRVSRRPWGYNAVAQTWLVREADDETHKELQIRPVVQYTLTIEREGDKLVRVLDIDRVEAPAEAE